MAVIGEIKQSLEPKQSLRIRPTGEASTLLVEDIATRESFRLSAVAAATLVAFAGGRPASEVADVVASLARVSAATIREVVSELLASGLLAAPSSSSTGLERRWRARNWDAAYDFQKVTDDMPFLDYDTDGYQVDRQRMAQYRLQEPDPMLELEQAVRAHEPCRSARIARLAEMLDGPICVGAGDGAPTVTLTDHLLISLLTLTLAFKAPGSKLRRTSPSGGARHPSEAYVLVWPGAELTPGVFAYDSVEDCIVKIWDTPPPPRILTGFLPPYSSFVPQAVIAIYSQFDRNMYRYREPRTFRSILLDGGHLASSIEEVADALGLASHVHHGVTEDELDDLLGVSILDKGFIVGVGLRGHE